MRKKDEALREVLLDCARNITDTEGTEAINIRALASKADVSIGTVYNYFSNKDDILLALTEEYWKKTLNEMWEEITADSFCRQLQEMYAFLSKRFHSSAGVLMHSLVSVEAAGRERMQSMQELLKKEIIQRMQLDVNVRSDIWNDTFTQDQYAQFILVNMMSHLQRATLNFDFLIEIIKRTIY